MGGNITEWEYHIISELIFLVIIIQILTCLNWWIINAKYTVDYRVASLFTRYLTAKGIIPESLKFIDQL